MWGSLRLDPTRILFLKFTCKIYGFSSREEPDISLSIVNSKARLYTRTLLVSPKQIFTHIGKLIKCENSFWHLLCGVTVRDVAGVAGEGKLVGLSKFHFWGT